MAHSDRGAPQSAAFLEHTARIVSACAASAPLSPAELVGLIGTVAGALGNVEAAPAAMAAQPRDPAVPVKKSVTPDFIVCLEDGKKLKMLKRHLMTVYGLTPQAYRDKWGLPKDYPMVAPNYAARRSALAKKFGLGSPKGRLIREMSVKAAKRGRPGKAAT